MKLKHLFIFLLVLVVSIANSNLYSQKNSDNYFHSYRTCHKKKINFPKTKFVTFKQHTLPYDYFLVFFIPTVNLKSVIQKQVQLTLKLQKQLHQKIASINIQQLLLHKKVTTSNTISYLYIA